LSNVIGIDASVNLVHSAQQVRIRAQLNNVTFRTEDLKKLNENEKYDLALCIAVLQYIPDDVVALRNLHKALKPGGRLLIEVPKPSSMARRHFGSMTLPPGYIRDGYSESDIREKLHEVGFKIERVTYLFGFFGSLAGELYYPLVKVPVVKWFAYPILLLISKVDSLLPNRDGNGILFVAVRSIRSVDK